MKTLSITLLSLVFFLHCMSQENSKKWQATAEINFTGVPLLHVSGTDSSYQNALSIAPSFDFRSPGGFGITYAPYFVTGGSNAGLYMHDVTIGLEQYGKKTWDLVADYSHFFFTGNSSIPTTPITNEMILEAVFKKWLLSPVASAGIGFGTNKDVTPSTLAYDVELAGGISHSFDWGKDNDFTFNVTPSALLNAGTNQYFSFLKLSKYISHSSTFKTIVKNPHATNKGRGRSNSTSTTTTNTSATSVSNEKLSINNLEINLESTVEHGAFSIRPSGSVYIPFAGANSLSGYWELNISYYF
ncbi:MAG TPA: hypothetical protein VLS85_00250 [Hanamia sp.]|nr:hypothetical protein [Hanamia sp.]